MEKTWCGPQGQPMMKIERLMEELTEFCRNHPTDVQTIATKRNQLIRLIQEQADLMPPIPV